LLVYQDPVSLFSISRLTVKLLALLSAVGLWSKHSGFYPSPNTTSCSFPSSQYINTWAIGSRARGISRYSSSYSLAVYCCENTNAGAWTWARDEHVSGTTKHSKMQTAGNNEVSFKCVWTVLGEDISPEGGFWAVPLCPDWFGLLLWRNEHNRIHTSATCVAESKNAKLLNSTFQLDCLFFNILKNVI